MSRGRPAIPLEGQSFGRLRVVGRCAPGLAESRGSAWWTCACACGREVPVRGDSLRYGLTRSCGCLRSDKARERLRAVNGRKRGANN